MSLGHSYSSALLADYAVGRLQARQRARVVEHLAACPECREWLETYRLLGAGLTAVQPTDHLSSAQIATWAASGDRPTGAAAKHLAKCGECRQELVLTTEAIGAARRVRSAERAGRFRPPRWWRQAAANWVAAASLTYLVLAVAIVLVLSLDAKNRRVISGGALGGEEARPPRAIYAAQVEISPGSVVVFEAPQVVLGDGFVVRYGAAFEARGTPSSPRHDGYR